MATSAADPNYLARLQVEESIFEHNDDVHDLPDIFHYWSNRYILPKFAGQGFTSAADMMAQGLERHMGGPESGPRRFASLGAGNCDFEIDLAQRLIAKGHTNFVIECLELNSCMLERGRVAAEASNVPGSIVGVQVDLNAWSPRGSYDALLAHQSLHHVLNLEEVIEQARACLKPGGQFLICDTIGRNGHLRWPEAVALIQQFWRRLPPSYRYNRQLLRYEEQFENWDCSTQCFEGIRAQDILPLLVSSFNFDSFLGYGNIIDPFIDRSFGPNFDATRDWDRQFIDEVHRRDEEGLSSGELKPTQMIAALSAGPRKTMVQGWDVENQIRWPGPADDALDKPQPTGDEYAWGSWPHSAQAELEAISPWLAQARRTSQDVATPDLREEVRARTAWALRLEQELAERTAWALKMEAELKEHQRLQAIWQKRSIRHKVKKLLKGG
jgi:SAM-dependent methyltransferase